MDGRIKKLMGICEDFRQRYGFKFKPGFGMGSVEQDGTVHIHCGYHEYKSRKVALALTGWQPFRDFCQAKNCKYEMVIKPNRYGVGGTDKRGEYRCRTEIVVRLKCACCAVNS